MEFIMFGLGMVAGAGLMFIYKCGCDSNRVRDNVRQGTQAYLVREHLERGMGIDAHYARKNFGIKNLSSTIDKLRKAGVEVRSVKDDKGHYYTL